MDRRNIWAVNPFKAAQHLVSANMDTNVLHRYLVEEVHCAAPVEVTTDPILFYLKNLLEACCFLGTVCSSNADPGRPCTIKGSSPVMRWHYNDNTKSCQQFSFHGCHGNGNNFDSQSECMSFCTPPSTTTMAPPPTPPPPPPPPTTSRKQIL